MRWPRSLGAGIPACVLLCPAAGDPSRAGWARLPLPPSRAEPRDSGSPKAHATSGSVHLLSGLSPSEAQAGWFSPRPCGRAALSCLSSLAKGRCCVFKLFCPLFFPSLYLFIYLLLVLKTKIVSLFSALETGGWMGGAVCVQSKGSVVPGECVLGGVPMYVRVC